MYGVIGSTGFCGRAVISLLQELKVPFRAITRDELAGDFSRLFQDLDIIFNVAGIRGIKNTNLHINNCIDSNVILPHRIVTCARNSQIKQIVTISSERANNPNTIYGYCKYLAEALFLEQSSESCQFKVIRVGNVLHSPDSVVPIWIKLVKTNQDVYVSRKDATRFFCTREDVAHFFWESLNVPKNLIIPEQKACSLGSLLTAIIEKYNPEYSGKIIESGLSEHEKLHEDLSLPCGKSDTALQFTFEELMVLV